MDNVKIIDHPILRYKLGRLRNKETESLSFRNILSELSSLMTYEMMKDIPMKKAKLETPLAKTEVDVFKDDILVVAVLRSGLAMMDGILNILPTSKIGHVGIYRDKFINNTIEYFFKIPQNHEGKTVIICDPIIATGDTMIASVKRLKEYGVGEIKVLSLLASPMALEKMKSFHPEVTVYACSIEESINEKGYLVPGVGDVGDRLFGNYES